MTITALAGCGAAELARRIARGEVSAVEVVQAHIARIEEVNPRINALVWPTFEEAQAVAQEVDLARQRCQKLGPLAGVPVSIKECFFLASCPTTIGLPHRRGQTDAADGELVARLRRAGAAILGKTNVPQLMVMLETDNPVYGRTDNPWDLNRTAGGSSGGEGALIGAGGSPLGLASDLGGSIRLPCHWCGLAGMKPTNRRLIKMGTAVNLRGMEALQFQPGPMARRVEDLELALKVLVGDANQPGDYDVPPVPLRHSADVRVEGLRIGWYNDDGCFPASPALRRAVAEAVRALRDRGAEVVPFAPPDVSSAIDLYLQLMSADGGADLRRLLEDSPVDHRVRRMLRVGRMPRFVRGPLQSWFRWQGQASQAWLLRTAGPYSADQYWQFTWRLSGYVRQFMDLMEAGPQGSLDAIVTPPHALVAPRHGHAVDLLPAASFAFLPNVLGVPVGVIPATRVRPGEESDRIPARDVAVRRALATEADSAGLPVGVQVFARHWREDVLFAVLGALEEHFRAQPDYPHVAPV